MYYLKPTHPSILKGSLYKLEGKKKTLVSKYFTISKDEDSFIIGSIICQWVAEGRSLDVLDSYPDDLPSQYEFHAWLDNDRELKILFESAKNKRHLTIVESIYKNLNKSKGERLSDDSADRIFKALTELRRHLKDSDSGPKTIINTRVFVPRILGDWFDKKDGVRTLKKK